MVSKTLKEYKFLSFFSGAGGLDYGLELAGWECLLALDNDKYCTETLKLNRHKFYSNNIDIKCMDIRDFRTNKYLRKNKIKKSDIFAVVGGPPCQAFSSAGKRLGLDDERGNVSIKYLNIIDDIKPKYAIIENVRGLLSTSITIIPKTRHKINVDPSLLGTKQGLMLLILDQFKQMGYSSSFTLYDMSRYGVPQKRERVIFIAFKGKTKIPLMEPTHGNNGLLKLKTLKNAIWNLRVYNNLEYEDFPDKRKVYYNMLNEGENWRDLPEHIQEEALGKSYHLTGGKTGFLRRLSWDNPSPTLITHPSRFPATDLCHPDKIRPLSVEEYREIQTFPTDWEFAGSTTNKYKQIGNAVPVRFGEVLGNHIIEFDNNIKSCVRKNIVYPEKLHSRYYNTSHIYFESLLKGIQQ